MSKKIILISLAASMATSHTASASKFRKTMARDVKERAQEMPNKSSTRVSLVPMTHRVEGSVRGSISFHKPVRKAKHPLQYGSELSFSEHPEKLVFTPKSVQKFFRGKTKVTLDAIETWGVEKPKKATIYEEVVDYIFFSMLDGQGVEMTGPFRILRDALKANKENTIDGRALLDTVDAFTNTLVRGELEIEINSDVKIGDSKITTRNPTNGTKKISFELQRVSGVEPTREPDGSIKNLNVIFEGSTQVIRVPEDAMIKMTGEQKSHQDKTYVVLPLKDLITK